MKPSLEERVINAAEEALANHQYVSAIDVLTGMGLLPYVNVEAWRKGRIEFLAQAIQGSPEKIQRAFTIFVGWAKSKGLRPTEVPYVRQGRAGSVELRVTQMADAETESFFRTHWVSPDLSERKQEQIKQRLKKTPQPVVFEIVRDTKCSECGVELPTHSLLFMDGAEPLCLACAGRDDLEFLAAGDTALTRRATKNSERTCVVVRFSRSRGRYERQGILVEKAALEKAERECADDAEERAKERERGAVQRQREDRVLVDRMTEQICALFPGCPPAEARAIAEYAAVRGSGRIGRSEAGRNLHDEALTLAVRAAIRHRHTNYEQLLASGVDREAARKKVAGDVDEMLDRWR